ncbi:MAG TPA: type II toxin-antitoxin system RelE/ParE family toxin [Pirellulales bacterium]|nr:type II toxin-antitoxin system RelE/ParE family toxin [Pirellulales bacterium]
MIVSFRHKGLKLLYAKGDRSRVRFDIADKAERLLTLLDQARQPADVDLPGFGLHALKGNLKGLWTRRYHATTGLFSGSQAAMSMTWT